jgi:hypothetical protein
MLSAIYLEHISAVDFVKKLPNKIEANNIEYGNIEKWGGWLNRNHSDGNIEFNFKNGNTDSKTGSNGVKTGS